MDNVGKILETKEDLNTLRNCYIRNQTWPMVRCRTFAWTDDRVQYDPIYFTRVLYWPRPDRTHGERAMNRRYLTYTGQIRAYKMRGRTGRESKEMGTAPIGRRTDRREHKVLKNFLRHSSHQIFERIHKLLNIVKKNN